MPLKSLFIALNFAEQTLGRNHYGGTQNMLPNSAFTKTQIQPTSESLYERSSIWTGFHEEENAMDVTIANFVSVDLIMYTIIASKSYLSYRATLTSCLLTLLAIAKQALHSQMSHSWTLLDLVHDESGCQDIWSEGACADNVFPKLQSLTLSHNEIADWVSIDAFNSLPSLSGLRLTGNPHPANQSQHRYQASLISSHFTKELFFFFFLIVSLLTLCSVVLLLECMCQLWWIRTRLLFAPWAENKKQDQKIAGTLT